MLITKEQVRDACNRIAPKYNFDPDLIFAVCLQEGDREKNGDFDPSVARLEQNYYRRYVEQQNFATTTEILFAASYGIMQLMGLSLYECGFFKWYYEQVGDDFKNIIKGQLSALAVVSALNAFCDHLDWMIEFGCKWMDKKRTLANGNIEKMLGYWNGDLSGKYANEVLTRLKNIKG